MLAKFSLTIVHIAQPQQQLNSTLDYGCYTGAEFLNSDLEYEFCGWSLSTAA